MSQFIFQVQRTIPNSTAVNDLSLYMETEMEADLLDQHPILIVLEVWRRKIIGHPEDLWAKSISKLEHVKCKDFESMRTTINEKIDEYKNDSSLQYEVFLEAVIVYLKPNEELKIDDIPNEPPLIYRSSRHSEKNQETNHSGDESDKSDAVEIECGEFDNPTPNIEPYKPLSKQDYEKIKEQLQEQDKIRGVVASIFEDCQIQPMPDTMDFD